MSDHTDFTPRPGLAERRGEGSSPCFDRDLASVIECSHSDRGPQVKGHLKILSPSTATIRWANWNQFNQRGYNTNQPVGAFAVSTRR